MNKTLVIRVEAKKSYSGGLKSINHYEKHIKVYEWIEEDFIDVQNVCAYRYIKYVKKFHI